MTDRPRIDRLATAVRSLVVRGGVAPAAPHDDPAARLAALERDVQEVRARVNALFFAVITASVADLVARMWLR